MSAKNTTKKEYKDISLLILSGKIVKYSFILVILDILIIFILFFFIANITFQTLIGLVLFEGGLGLTICPLLILQRKPIYDELDTDKLATILESKSKSKMNSPNQKTKKNDSNSEKLLKIKIEPQNTLLKKDTLVIKTTYPDVDKRFMNKVYTFKNNTYYAITGSFTSIFLLIISIFLDLFSRIKF